MQFSIKEMLTKMIELGASDLHIVVNAPPMIRVNGALEALAGYDPLKQDDTRELVYSVMNEDQIAQFETEKEDWNVYRTEDGSRVRIKLVATDIVRLDEFDPSTGEPIYVVRSQNLLGLEVPEGLKEKSGTTDEAH